MGFSLKMMFDELLAILDSEMKDSKKVKALMTAIVQAKIYAKECGKI